MNMIAASGRVSVLGDVPARLAAGEGDKLTDLRRRDVSVLRKILMIGLVVLGLAIAGLSVASGTVWRPSDTVVMTGQAKEGTTLLTTAPGVLGLVNEKVTISAESSPEATVVLAIGSVVDVTGWVADTPATTVTGAVDWDTLASTGPAATPTPDPATEPPADATDPPADATEPAPDPTTPADTPVVSAPDPTGSDMWVTTVSGTGSATLDWSALASDQVLLVAAVGDGATAPTLTLTWPREVTTPWMWPGVAAGIVLVLLGLSVGFFLLRARRTTTGKLPTAPATTVSVGADENDLDSVPPAGLTRRELRERQQRIDAAKLAAEAPTEPEPEPVKKPKRQWPWTGAIAVVKPAGDPDVPEVDPKRPAWLPEGTASTSASSWRQNWGLRPESVAPRPETGAIPLGFPARGSLRRSLDPADPLNEPEQRNPQESHPALATPDRPTGAAHPAAPPPVQAYLRRSGLSAQAPAGQAPGGGAGTPAAPAPADSRPSAPATGSQPLTRRALRESGETGATPTVSAGHPAAGPGHPTTAPTSSLFVRLPKRSLGSADSTTTPPDTTTDGE